jgi:hypothetical protein
MRAKEFTIEQMMGDKFTSNQWGMNEPWSDGGGGGQVSWQSKVKDKYGVELPSDAVIASGISGKTLYDPKKEPESILKKPANDSAKKRDVK